MIHQAGLNLDTRAPVEIVDVTERVRAAVRASGVRCGLAAVATLHTTSGIRIGEAEPGLFADLAEFLGGLAPAGRPYRHDRAPVDGRANAHAHLAAFLLGASESVPVRDGDLALGAWQRIFFVELDGPRHGRQVTVTVVGE